MATKKLPDFPARATLPNYGAAVAFTPDGSRLLALDSSKVFAIERGTKDLLGFADLGCYGHSLAVGGDVIALATMNGVELYDLEGHARQSLALAAERPEGACHVTFSADGSRLAAITGDPHAGRPDVPNVIQVWAIEDGRANPLQTIESDTFWIGLKAAAFVAGGGQLVTFQQNKLRFWDLAGGDPRIVPTAVRPLGLNASQIVAMTEDRWLVGFDGDPLAVISSDGAIVWQSNEPFQRVALSADGAMVIAGRDRDLVFFSADGRELRRIARKGRFPIRSLALATDGWLAVGSEGGRGRGVECFPPEVA